VTHSPGRRLRRGRLLVFSVLVPGLALAGVHLWAERQGRGPWLRDLLLEDVTLEVVEPLLAWNGGAWATTPYAHINSPIGTLEAAQDGPVRAIALGGSFLFGDPYGAPGLNPRPGGIPWWLDARLGTRGSVLNLAGMGDASSRVARKAEALAGRADVLLVATGNNEYPIEPPSRWRRAMRRHALMRRLALMLGESRDRSVTRDLARLYAAGLSEADVRARFAANLEAVAAAGAAHDVPVLLATLPNNLWWPLMVEGGGLTADAAACVGPLAEHLRPEADSATAGFVSELVAGRGSGCASELLVAWNGGRAGDAIEASERCEDGVEILGLVGGALASAGRGTEARPFLQIAAETKPLLIRPSFNDLVRQTAARHEGVFLVDLEARALADAAPSVPGPELFVDVCHLHWAGYRAMAEEFGRVLIEAGVVADLDDAPDPVSVGLDPVDAASITPDRSQPWGCPAGIPAP